MLEHKIGNVLLIFPLLKKIFFTGRGSNGKTGFHGLEHSKKERQSIKGDERVSEGEREGKRSGKNLLPIQVGCPIGTTFAHKVPLFNPSLLAPPLLADSEFEAQTRLINCRHFSLFSSTVSFSFMSVCISHFSLFLSSIFLRFHNSLTREIDRRESETITDPAFTPSSLR